MILNNVTETITKLEIKGDTFYKVLMEDKTTSAINPHIFYKVNNSYRLVTQAELPKEYVNLIATMKFKPTSEEERQDLTKFLNRKVEQVNVDKLFDEKIIFGNVLHTPYLLQKEATKNYYVLNTMILNEFGMLTATCPIFSTLLPYVMADITTKGNKFKKELFLLDTDLFTLLQPVGDDVIGLIYQAEELEDQNLAQFTLVGIYLIRKESNGSLTVVTSQEGLSKVKNIESIIDSATNELCKRLQME